MYTQSSLADVPISELVEKYAVLVKRIAFHLIARLPHTVDADDLIQAGMIGLLDAADHYNDEHGASFETYAGIRIRGAMLDEIRRNDWAPRSVHKKAREIVDVIKDLEQQLGRHARDEEIAKALNISIEEYHQQLHNSAGHQVFSLDEFTDNNQAHAQPMTTILSGPVDTLQSDNFQSALANAIATLPDRERLLMGLYYNEELNLKEIGEVLGVSESRVSQIHSQAVIRLRSKLSDWLN